MNHIEAMKQALEALESCSTGDYSTGHVIHPSFDVDAVNKAIEAIDEALAEQPAQQQEPVAVARVDDLERGGRVRALAMGLSLDAPLYTSPQSKPWVGLTDEDIAVVLTGDASLATRLDELTPSWIELVKAVEAKLREKNA